MVGKPAAGTAGGAKLKLLTNISTYIEKIEKPRRSALRAKVVAAAFSYTHLDVYKRTAYETAAVAGTRAREEEGADAGEMEALFRERAEGKCILFPTPSASVEITEAEVTVSRCV